jgi:hydrogenase expression/formation protein HypC
MHDPYDLAQPGKVIEIQGETATVDLGGGTLVNANIALTDVKTGDYVLVHAGYILRVIDIGEAERMLDRWRQ